MLHAKLFRSPVAHAGICRLDVSRARSLPGVTAVLTSQDVPGKRFGFAIRDEEIFASDKVRYVGDVLAAVAAVDEETAEKALDLIELDYEELPAALTIDQALRENAPLVHEQLGSYGMNSMMARVWQPVPGTNIAHQVVHARGDVRRGFSEADEIFDDTFFSQQVQHVSLEPHAAVAQVDGDGLTVWTSTQNVFQVQFELAHLFEMPESSVRIVGPKIGGGFGGKNVVLRIEQYVAALALKTAKKSSTAPAARSRRRSVSKPESQETAGSRQRQWSLSGTPARTPRGCRQATGLSKTAPVLTEFLISR
jgi:CO/xanthine dehydrogenase Mo-binding subunit